MKRYLKSIVVAVLTAIARAALMLHRPYVIAVVGSVGKTTTKDAVYAAVQTLGTARTGKKSYNSDIGVPLSILGLDNPWTSFWGWMRTLVLGVWRATAIMFPKYIVLEIGADHPGDVRKIAAWLRVDMVVCTRWGDTPVHIEFFESAQALKDEDAAIFHALVADTGIVIYNNDDTDAVRYARTWPGLTMSYGKGAVRDESENHAMIRFTAHVLADDAVPATAITIADAIGDVSFKSKALGDHQGYPFAAAWAVGVALNAPREALELALSKFTPPPGRMNVLAGKDSTVLIDDTYNSSPVALEAALEAAAGLQRARITGTGPQVTGKLIAVLGDMKELGTHAKAEHERFGPVLVDRGYDAVVCVGELARLIGQSAIAAGMHDTNVSFCTTADTAARILPELVAQGDVLLLKGSQSARIEKITKALLADQSSAAAVLVRQEAAWQNR